jgi:hypothetical protein
MILYKNLRFRFFVAYAFLSLTLFVAYAFCRLRFLSLTLSPLWGSNPRPPHYKCGALPLS